MDILASESRAHVVEGVSVGSGACLLEPPEGALDTISPSGVLVLASVGVRERRHHYAFFLPVCASAAACISTLLVTRADANAGIEVEVGHSIMWCGESALAVERRFVGGNNAADLIGSPVTDKISTSLLKEINMARVKTNAASSCIVALIVLLTLASTS